MTLPTREALQSIFHEADASTIDLLLEHSTTNEYPADTYLCNEGQVEDTFFIMLAGRVDVFRTKAGHTFVLDYQEAGSSFGEIALILDSPRTADVVTTEPTTVLEISRATFDQYIRPNADALLDVVQHIIGRILTQQERRLTELVRKEKDD
jgi:CRP/FNR family transcriptional regulator, cyclic AMP receptor protein